MNIPIFRLYLCTQHTKPVCSNSQNCAIVNNFHTASAIPSAPMYQRGGILYHFWQASGLITLTHLICTHVSRISALSEAHLSLQAPSYAS
jgi:hypothetical protein